MQAPSSRLELSAIATQAPEEHQADTTTQTLPSHPDSPSAPPPAASNSLNESARDGVLARLTLATARAVGNFWKRQISIVTGHEACRDHFANERTFLGYLRTSFAFATLGVVSFQLFLLGDSNAQQGVGGCRLWYGKGLALACVGLAMLVAVSGALRFWRHQNAILRGKAQVGGWEINTVGICGLAITILTLVLVLLADCE